MKRMPSSGLIALVAAFFAAGAQASPSDLFDGAKPPLAVEDFQILNPQAKVPMALSGGDCVEFCQDGKRDKAEGKAKKNPVSRYGVIINGDPSRTHLGNSIHYLVHMVTYYKIPLENVILLTPPKTIKVKKGVKLEILDSTHANLVKVGKALKTKVDANDELYLYTTGHGGLEKGQVSLDLWGPKEISPSDFDKLFKALPAAAFGVFSDQCFSGGFAQAMTSDAKRDVLAISSTDGKNSTVCSFFTLPFLAAIKDMKNDTAPKDGRVSEWEAFLFAAKCSKDLHSRARGPGGVKFAPGCANAQYLTSGKVKNPGKKVPAKAAPKKASSKRGVGK